MRKKTSTTVLGLGLTTFVIGVLSLVMLVVQAAMNVSCWVDWKDSGRLYRFQYGPGVCQVHDGKGWVPAERVRVD